MEHSMTAHAVHLAQIVPANRQNGLFSQSAPPAPQALAGQGDRGQAANGSVDEAAAMLRGAHFNVEGVAHRYRNARGFALEGVSLKVEPQEAVALIGRSGCGKSTLLHIMAGLLRPTQGGVHVDGAAVTGPSPSWVMMFQQPSLFPWMSVAQNVALGLRFTNRQKEAPQRVAEMLELVELTEFADRNVQDLSGGQQQRVALARSLAPAPKALLLDEPFSALDAFTRVSLQRDVRRIAKELGITLVLVTHDINEAIVMTANPGRIFCEVNLGGGREEAGEGVHLQRTRKALMEAYEAAAGLTAAAPKVHPVNALHHADIPPQRISA